MPIWEFVADVEASFKVGELFVKPPGLYAGFDPLQGVVFSLDFGDDCLSVNFKLNVPFMMVVVSLDFSIGGGVVEGRGLFSQSVIGSPPSLE